MKTFGFKSRPNLPPTVATDTIVPFHYYDDSKHTNGLCFDFIFRFDDILDDEKLRKAFSRLLELGDWRKLGARIRRNDQGRLEYHVPQYYDEKRPGFDFSTITFDIAVDEHPQASRMAQPHNLNVAGRPIAFTIPSHKRDSDFKTFIRNPEFPERLDDWIYSDSPQIGIRVIHFRDATLVTLSFLHSLTDMMGVKAITDAWTAVLRGDENQVTPFLGFSDDPLGSLSELKFAKPAVKYLFSDFLITGWIWVLFAIRYYFLIEMLWSQREEERIIFLPANYVIQMRRDALEDLARQEPSDSVRGPFVSEGDVIFAWWTRIVLRAERPSPDRTLNMRNTCCCRSLMEELGLIPSVASALVTNAVFGCITFLKVKEALEQPLGLTAAEVRKSLVQQRGAQQLRALDSIRRDCLDNRNHPAVFGDPKMFMFMISNWEKAKLFGVDFSAAVVKNGLDLSERENELGRPSCVQGSGTRHYATRNTGVVIGKDAGGNYWLSYNLRKKAWAAVDRELLFMSEGSGQ